MKYNLAFRQLIGERFNYTCGYCGKKLKIGTQDTKYDKDIITIDHIDPILNDGDEDISNLMASCKSCNSKKGSKSLKEFRHYVANPNRLTDVQIDWIETRYNIEIRKDLYKIMSGYIFPFEAK